MLVWAVRTLSTLLLPTSFLRHFLSYFCLYDSYCLPNHSNIWSDASWNSTGNCMCCKHDVSSIAVPQLMSILDWLESPSAACVAVLFQTAKTELSSLRSIGIVQTHLHCTFWPCTTLFGLLKCNLFLFLWNFALDHVNEWFIRVCTILRPNSIRPEDSISA